MASEVILMCQSAYAGSTENVPDKTDEWTDIQTNRSDPYVSIC